jgi:hypothetical protein
MWLTGLGLALGIATVQVPVRDVPEARAAKSGPTLRAEQFTHWPMTSELEEPHRREKLHRLVEITSDGDPDKARFWFVLAEAEAEHWQLLQGRASILAARAGKVPAAKRRAFNDESRVLAGRAESSRQDAIAAYTTATAFPTFERRDAALYWLARLSLADP